MTTDQNLAGYGQDRDDLPEPPDLEALDEHIRSLCRVLDEAFDLLDDLARYPRPVVGGFQVRARELLARHAWYWGPTEDDPAPAQPQPVTPEKAAGYVSREGESYGLKSPEGV